MPKKIVVATSNPGKLSEIKQMLSQLDIAVCGLSDFPPVTEPEENADTFAQNACDKAAYYANHTQCWTLADDSGLVVDALGGAPGVHSARYASADCKPNAPRSQIDPANNAKLLRELQNTPDEKRTARFVCSLALAAPGEILAQTQGTVEGKIIDQHKGDGGFGYDPLFFVSEMGKTTAELSADEKNKISHRGKAVRKMTTILEQLLK